MNVTVYLWALVAIIAANGYLIYRICKKPTKQKADTKIKDIFEVSIRVEDIASIEYAPAKKLVAYDKGHVLLLKKKNNTSVVVGWTNRNEAWIEQILTAIRTALGQWFEEAMQETAPSIDIQPEPAAYVQPLSQADEIETVIIRC